MVFKPDYSRPNNQVLLASKFAQQLIDEGMDEQEANIMAIQEVKRMFEKKDN